MGTTFTFKKYAKDTSGQFSIMFGLAASVLMMGTVVAIDTNNLHSVKSQMNDTADAAAVAAAAAYKETDAKRREIAQTAIYANASPDLAASIVGAPVINFDDANKEVTVSFNTQSKTMMAGFFGKRELPVSTVSVVSYPEVNVNPVSISFALDVSGSMGWNTSDGQVKIEALKESVNAMFVEIEDQVDDPKALRESMRTGMSTYNTMLRTRTDMRDGWRHVGNDVRRLIASGGTNATPALDFALDQMRDDRARRRTAAAASATHKEFVIFMTDGDNNRPEWDVSSLAICDQMKSDGIEVFTVAFAAPSKGQALLQSCASDDVGSQQHYFDASDGEAFREAFREIGREIAQRTVRIKA